MSTVVVTGTQWVMKVKVKSQTIQQKKLIQLYVIKVGSNAGHTVTVDGKEFKQRLMPSGMLYDNKICVIANGVAFDPEVILQEMEALKKDGYSVDGLRISNRAHVVMPYHRLMDGLEEENKGELKIGTTKRGIGPCYMDRDNRIGIRVCDLIDEETFSEKLKTALETKNRELVKLYGKRTIKL